MSEEREVHRPPARQGFKVFSYISDFINPGDPQGRTYRQINADKEHSIPIGSLVEIESGVRLFVVFHARDCDQAPLYYLGPDKDDTIEDRPGFKNRLWGGGYPESSLKVIR